jgi:hypothetical protein
MSSNLYLNDYQTKFYKYLGFSSTVSTSFTSATLGGGAAYDGTNLLTSKAASSEIVKLTGFSATVSSSFTYPGSSPAYDLEWTGTDLLSADDTTKARQHTGFSATITSSAIINRARGVTWDGTNLISTGILTGKAYKYTGFSATIASSFAIVAASPFGCAWDGTNFIICQGIVGSPKIVRYTGFSSTVLDSFIQTIGSQLIGMSWGTDAASLLAKQLSALGVG